MGFIILVPIVYGFLQGGGRQPHQVRPARGGHHAGRARGGATAPRHRGRAAIVKGDIGWITIIGLAICIPLAALAQVVAGWLNRKGYPMLPTTAEQFAAFGNSEDSTASKARSAPGVGTIMALILIPLALIMAGTTGATLLPKGDSLRNVLGFIGSPIFALMVAVGLAMFLLGRNQGWNRERTNAIMESALPPAATVILVTGAGGVFAKVLTASGIGAALSQSLTATHLPLILLAFIIRWRCAPPRARPPWPSSPPAACWPMRWRVAGIPLQVALLTVAIGFGSLGLSHVNDSGFWIVTRYLGLSVGDGLRTWTVLTTVLGMAGFALTALLWVAGGLSPLLNFIEGLTT